jgi:hypothetical protein
MLVFLVIMEKTKGQPLVEAVRGAATDRVVKLRALVKKKEENLESGKALVIEFIKYFF